MFCCHKRKQSQVPFSALGLFTSRNHRLQHLKTRPFQHHLYPFCIQRFHIGIGNEHSLTALFTHFAGLFRKQLRHPVQETWSDIHIIRLFCIDMNGFHHFFFFSSSSSFRIRPSRRRPSSVSRSPSAMAFRYSVRLPIKISSSSRSGSSLYRNSSVHIFSLR